MYIQYANDVYLLLLLDVAASQDSSLSGVLFINSFTAIHIHRHSFIHPPALRMRSSVVILSRDGRIIIRCSCVRLGDESHLMGIQIYVYW